MRLTTRTLCVTGAITFGALALAGCAGPQSLPLPQLPKLPQSQEEACQSLETKVKAYSATVEEDLTAAKEEKDLSKLIEIEKKMLSEFKSIGNGVSNPEVKEPYLNLISITQEMIPYLEKMLEDPTAAAGDDFEALADRATKAGESFGKVCPGVSSGPLG